MDFGPVLDPFGPKIGSFLAHFWLHFWTPFGAKNGPPSGGHFKPKHKEFKGFWCFPAPQKGSVLGPLLGQKWLHFGLHFRSHFGSFWGALLGQPEPPILPSLRAGLGPRLKNFLQIPAC